LALFFTFLNSVSSFFFMSLFLSFFSVIHFTFLTCFSILWFNLHAFFLFTSNIISFLLFIFPPFLLHFNLLKPSGFSTYDQA
jgi:hypothetical protein